MIRFAASFIILTLLFWGLFAVIKQTKFSSALVKTIVGIIGLCSLSAFVLFLIVFLF